MNLSEAGLAFTLFIGALMVVGIVTDKPAPGGVRTRRNNALYAVLIGALVVFGLTVGKNLS